MALTLTRTYYQHPPNIPWTRNALNKLAQASDNFSGAVDTGDITDGAVTPAKVTPGAYFYAALTGAINAYALALSPAPPALADGLKVRGKFTSSALRNTAASTLNVNSLGTVGVKRIGNSPLLPGDLREDEVYEFEYSSTGAPARWQLLNPSNPAIRDGTNNGSTATVYNFTTSPVLTALYEGAIVSVEIPIDSGAAPTLTIDAAAAKPIRKLNNVAPAVGELKLNQRALLVYDLSLDAWLLLTPSAGGADTAINASSRNLDVVRTSVTVMTISADEVILRDDTAGVNYRATAVSETATITVAGAGGLDTGAEAANTLYYLWLIYNGTVVDALLSTSATAPALPAGYTYKARVGAVRNNAGSDFGDYNIFSNTWEFISDAIAIPGAAGVVSVAHNLGRAPRFVRWTLLNATAQYNWVAGDEIDVGFVLQNFGNDPQGIVPIVENGDSTNARAMVRDVSLRVFDKTTFALTAAITNGNWRIKCHASL